jgi:DNA-binding winged helix-turn-helix (wHTH) protein/Tol biopolymer transport system component
MKVVKDPADDFSGSRKPLAYEFGPFRIEVELCQLLRGGEAVPLTPKAFDTLLTLVRRRDHVVDRDELMKIVWPDSFVSEDSLTQSISVLRRALGDVSNQPEFIVTIPRRGYRFIAPVTEIPQAERIDVDALQSHARMLIDGEHQPAQVGTSQRKWIGISIVASLLAASATIGRALLVGTPPPAAGPLRFAVNAPPTTKIVSGGVLSPDSHYLAFVAEHESGIPQIWVRALESTDSHALPGTEGAFRPFWSPDSRLIGFFANGTLKKVDLNGNPPQTIANVAPSPAGGSWSTNGTILFADRLSALYSVSAAGGASTPVTRLDPSAQERRHRWPQFLPDGQHFLYSVVSENPDREGTYVGSLSSGERVHVLDGWSPAVYAPPGYLVYVRDRVLLAQPFDVSQLRLTGGPSTIAGNVSPPLMTNGSVISAARGDLLAFGGPARKEHLVWFGRAGQQLGIIEAPGLLQNPALSPDQKQILAQSDDGPRSGVWLADLEGGGQSQIAANGSVPLWSPDGARIAFTSGKIAGIDDIFVRSAENDGKEELLLQTPATKHVHDWSPDGRYLVYVDTNPRTKIDLWLLPMFGARKPIPFLRTPANEMQAQVSPDDHWIAYASDESGVWEVYVQPFPAQGGVRHTISVGGGSEPQWRRDGRELFYLAADHTLMAVDVTPGGTWRAGRPKALFRTRVPEGAMPRNHYAVTADGQRFVIESKDEADDQDLMTVFVNWAAALKR